MKRVYLLVGLILASIVAYAVSASLIRDTTYDEFAKCIDASGTKFYGAYWCPHCQRQKKMFGDSADYLPYIECAEPGVSGQLAICNEANIQSYPTWEFPDGERMSGELPLLLISEKTSCPLSE